ncbi:Periodic tryptophan protein [Novymonas esmeraldas]|uniref:Periodic tryptophan protein n=1 Tax=Novymonas esmeraldas TaxID=1808958 RepID=A0AAW0ETG0_9TRYP
MQNAFQLAAVHGMLYTGGNVVFSPDGAQLYSPVNNLLSSIQLQQAGHLSLTCSNSSISCFDLSPDGDLALVVGQRGLGFFYSISARVVLDTLSFPPNCSVACVKFSPCGKYVAIALESTLQVYTAPAKRVVSFHGCHRVEQLHAVLTRPITHLDWTADSEHLLVCGQDARMKIVPRQGKVHHKGMAAQHNSLVGHRSMVLGAWFTTRDSSAVVSVAADNAVIVWRRSAITRREVMQAIATAQMQARVGDAEADAEAANSNINDDGDDANDTPSPRSFLERQRLEQLRLDGVRVSVAEDSYLPPVLRNAFEVKDKFLLSHKGTISVAAFHAPRGLLAVGYSSGIFAIHTLPEATATTATAAGGGELTLVHLLSISAQSLTAAAFAPSGDWIAFGSAHLKQLLVWDWKAEAYVLKEQAHYYDIACAAITADSTNIISGGEEGKVKVWKVASGQCFATFTEHTGPITGISTSASTNAFFTSSLDGTARGYDLVRYRQFRVFSPPEPTQLSCIAVDPSGDVLATGSSQMNKVFLFAVQTGRVVDTFQGHEAPITCIAFHPSGTTLASGSMDHNLVLWDLFNQDDGGERLKGDGEVLDVGTEVLCIAYSASGRRMAVLTARQEISVYETTVADDPQLVKTFLTRFDAAGGWRKEVGPNSANTDTHFTRISFSPEGEKLIAGGDSKWLVLYHATQGYVLRKWPITHNLDVQGAEEQYQWRNASEAGFLGDIDVEEDDMHLTRRKLLEMPGSRHRHFATGKRKTELTARAMDVAFAATGTEFIAATTDGLQLFSTRVARPRFQPLQLTSRVTTEEVRRQLASGQPVLALIGALNLGDAVLGVESLRRMPRESIPVAVTAIPSSLFALFVQWVSEEVDHSRGLEHALLWAQSLLLHSSEAFGGVAAAPSQQQQREARVLPALKTLQRSLYQHRLLTQLSRENYFSIKYLADAARMNTSTLKAVTEDSTA